MRYDIHTNIKNVSAEHKLWLDHIYSLCTRYAQAHAAGEDLESEEYDEVRQRGFARMLRREGVGFSLEETEDGVVVRSTTRPNVELAKALLVTYLHVAERTDVIMLEVECLDDEIESTAHIYLNAEGETGWIVNPPSSETP